jgi:hypothetical protein
VPPHDHMKAGLARRAPAHCQLGAPLREIGTTPPTRSSVLQPRPRLLAERVTPRREMICAASLGIPMLVDLRAADRYLRCRPDSRTAYSRRWARARCSPAARRRLARSGRDEW